MQNQAQNVLTTLQNAPLRAVGSNKVLKAIEQRKASCVYLAKDVDHFLSQTIINASQIANIPLVFVETRAEIASACSVPVKTAAAAILK